MKIKVIGGTSNPALTEKICAYLGVAPLKFSYSRFSDGEIFVEIGESVRGDDVYVIQSTCYPANDHIMELLLILDALRRASATKITAVIPYFGYARQDRKVQPRTPISAKLVANIITISGAERVVTVDLHAGQIQGFFDIPVDNIYALPVLLPYIKEKVKVKKPEEMVIVAPDTGGADRARSYAKRLECGLAVIDKRRPKPNEAEVVHVVGDVKDKVAVLVDDIVDTGTTLVKACSALIENGAKEVYACCTHPVLSGNASEKIENSQIKVLAVTDTIPLKGSFKKIEVLSVGDLLGEAIKRIHTGGSVSSLFI